MRSLGASLVNLASGFFRSPRLIAHHTHEHACGDLAGGNGSGVGHCGSVLAARGPARSDLSAAGPRLARPRGERKSPRIRAARALHGHAMRARFSHISHRRRIDALKTWDVGLAHGTERRQAGPRVAAVSALRSSSGQFGAWRVKDRLCDGVVACILDRPRFDADTRGGGVRGVEQDLAPEKRVPRYKFARSRPGLPVTRVFVRSPGEAKHTRLRICTGRFDLDAHVCLRWRRARARVRGRLRRMIGRASFPRAGTQ